MPLSLHNAFVFSKKLSSLEILALHQALNALGIVLKFRIRTAVLQQQIVFHRHEKTRASWIALTSRAPAKLIVDAPALMPIGANHVQSAQLRHAQAELDIHSASGHVGRNGQCP